MLQCRCVELRASRERLSGPSSALVFRGLLWTFAAAVLGLVLMIGRRGLERVPNPGQAAAAAPMKSTCRDAGARPSTSPAGTPPRPRRCLERTRGSQRDVSHAKTTHKTRRTARVGAVSPQWSTTTSGKIRKENFPCTVVARRSPDGKLCSCRRSTLLSLPRFLSAQSQQPSRTIAVPVGITSLPRCPPPVSPVAAAVGAG